MNNEFLKKTYKNTKIPKFEPLFADPISDFGCKTASNLLHFEHRLFQSIKLTLVRDKKKQADFCKSWKNKDSDMQFFHKIPSLMELTQLFCDVDDLVRFLFRSGKKINSRGRKAAQSPTPNEF